SFVADTTGRIRSFHQSDDVRVETEQIVAAVSAWLDASCRLSPEMKLGAVGFTLLSCEEGSVYVQVVDGDTRQFVAIACDRTARMGVVMHKISEVASGIRGEREQ
ncbi:MAG TPA: hypothetical protein PK036_17080, partial [Geobacteraceae bacterium]|nr:hypothetical protein [Geobacteraceae bacterium]